MAKNIYDSANSFRKDFSLGGVEKNGERRYVDKEGREYDYVGGFYDGLCLVGKDGKYGFVNKKGKLIIPVKFGYRE